MNEKVLKIIRELEDFPRDLWAMNPYPLSEPEYIHKKRKMKIRQMQDQISAISEAGRPNHSKQNQNLPNLFYNQFRI